MRRLLGRLTCVGLLGAMAWSAAPASAATIPEGALLHATGKAGCLSTERFMGCANVGDLGGAEGVATSPDGRNVYVSTSGDIFNGPSQVITFNRNTSTGALTRGGCVGSGCSTALRGVSQPSAIEVSPDGRNVYAVGQAGIAALTRNTETGELTPLGGGTGCLVSPAADDCGTLRAREYALDLAISPGGGNVYVVSVGTDSTAGEGMVSVLDRAADGSLSQSPDVDGCVGGPALGECTGVDAMRAPAGLTVTPDGRQVLVASAGQDPQAPNAGALVVLDRNLAGDLTQPDGAAGCISNNPADAPCAAGRNLGPSTPAVSPDGTMVVTGALAVLARDPATGALTQAEGDACCASLPVDDASFADFQFSPDGQNVHLFSGNVLISMRRAGAGLEQLPRRYTCISGSTGNRCLGARGLFDTGHLALSPDGHNAYVASWTLEESFEPGGVAVFDRVRSAYTAPRAKIRIRGVPRRRCASRGFRVRVRARSPLDIWSTTVRRDRRRLRNTNRASVRVKVRVRGLRAGRHTIRVGIRDGIGQVTRKRVRFKRCRTRRA